MATKREAAITKRLDQRDWRMSQLERDTSICVEIPAMFVRFWHSNALPPTESERALLRTQGGDRFDGFMASLGRRLAKGPMVQQEIAEEVTGIEGEWP